MTTTSPPGDNGHADEPTTADTPDTGDTPAAAQRQRGTKRKRAKQPRSPKATRLTLILLALAAVIIILDQASKQIAVTTLEQGDYHPLLGDILGLQLVFNPGAAFSIATGLTWVFTIVSLIVVVVIVRISRTLGSRAWTVALGMLLGGAVGNLIDRLFRDPSFAQGHVVDFINYNGWFVGNVADIAIVGAAIVIALLAFTGRDVDGTHLSRDRTGDADQPEDTADAETSTEQNVSSDSEAVADSPDGTTDEGDRRVD